MPVPVEKYQPLPDCLEISDHLIDRLGVSRDIVAFGETAIVSGALIALAENAHMVVPEVTVGEVYRRHNQMMSLDILPPHLQAREDFEARWRQLIGITPEERTNSELRSVVRQNAGNVDSTVQQEFEYGMARTAAWFVHDTATMSPYHYAAMRDSIFMPPLQSAGHVRFVTGDNLHAPLPTEHAGVIQVAPTFTEAHARLDEAQAGDWQNVALLGANHFSAELARQLAKKAKGISLKRVFASHTGIAKGAQELYEDMRKNKRTKKGYGAMLLADVGGNSLADIKTTIDVAPHVLATNGILVISNLVELSHNDGTVHEVIQHARKVLGCDPHGITSITQTDDSTIGGRQVMLINPAKRPI